jgi:hypothetical protein
LQLLKNGIALSTSEDPLWDYMGRTPRGQEVRMMDIPALVSEMNDVFDGKNAAMKIGTTVEDRGAFVESQQLLTIKYQGEALRAYLTRRAADRNAKATLRKYVDFYCAKVPLPCQETWLGRIHKYFAVNYASTAQAIDYDVVPWRRPETLEAIASCMSDAMDQLLRSSGGISRRSPKDSDSALLGKFKKQMRSAEFAGPFNSEVQRGDFWR